MIFNKTVVLKNNKTCLIRNATGIDAEEVLNNLILMHFQTDFLLSYPEESTFTVEQEAAFLANKEQSENEVQLCAIIEGKIVGTAGIDSLGNKYKIKHRADFGIAINKEYWGMGIGTQLSKACIECAKSAGYKQLEITCVSENNSAVSMYKKLGFSEYGRNPKGFYSKYTGFQELILMRLEL